MSEFNRGLESILRKEEAEMKKLEVEFPIGRKLKVPRSDGSISKGRVLGVEKRKKGVRIEVVIEGEEGVIVKFVRPEALREANLS